MRRALLLLFLSVAAAQEPRFAADRPVDLLHLRLDAATDPRTRGFSATAAWDLVALRDLAALSFDAVGLMVREVAVDGTPARFRNDGARLEIDAPLRAGERRTVAIAYAVPDPDGGLHFFGPTDAEPEVPHQLWTQGEAEDTRRWIPCLDHPNERFTSEMAVTVPEGFDVLSNGRLIGKRRNPDGTITAHWRQEKDHVAYLLSLVVGRFEVVEEDWKGLPLSYWVPPGRRDDVPRSFGKTGRMIDLFQEKLGVPYPWEKYAQVVVEQFSHSGMENTSATTLTDRTLHDERAHLDVSSDWLVAHELAHQWFGNLVTCRDWAHTWLNEGFASYFETLWEEHENGTDAAAYDLFGKARRAIDGGRTLPIVFRAYDGPWQQFDARAYPKGAWVVHMIRARLGDERFWAAVGRYLRTNAHRCVETFDLRKAIEEETGVAFERFFYDWTERPGHPVVSVATRWHADRRLLQVDVTQTQREDAFHFPLTVDFRVGGGEPLAVAFDVRTKAERFYVPLAAAPEMVRVDPGFTVLLELSENKGRDLWVRQLHDDADPIGRIRAALHLGGTGADPDRAELAKALASERFWGVRIEICRALGRAGGDVARDALLNASREPHPKVRRAAVEELGKFRDDAKVLDALGAIVRNGDASYYVEAAAVAAWAALRPKEALPALAAALGRESHDDVIRQAALRGIGDQQDASSLDLLLEWTRRGRSRSCRAAALDALARLAKGGGLDDAATRRVVEACVACLARGEHRHVKAQAAQALRELGQPAAPALFALEALALHDRERSVRDNAKAALERIRAGAPAPLELDRLRAEIEKLAAANRALEDRMKRLEPVAPR